MKKKKKKAETTALMVRRARRYLSKARKQVEDSERLVSESLAILEQKKT